MATKPITLRLDNDMARDLEMVARVRGSTVANAVRLAIARYLNTLAADPDFQAQIDAALVEEQRVLRRFSETH